MARSCMLFIFNSPFTGPFTFVRYRMKPRLCPRASMCTGSLRMTGCGSRLNMPAFSVNVMGGSSIISGCAGGSGSLYVSP